MFIAGGAMQAHQISFDEYLARHTTQHHRALTPRERGAIYSMLKSSLAEAQNIMRGPVLPKTLVALGVPYSERRLRDHLGDMAEAGMIQRVGERKGYLLQ